MFNVDPGPAWNYEILDSVIPSIFPLTLPGQAKWLTRSLPIPPYPFFINIFSKKQPGGHKSLCPHPIPYASAQGRTGSPNRPGKFSLTGPHYQAETQFFTIFR